MNNFSCLCLWLGFFLLLGFLLVIVWWNLIVVFQDLLPVCLLSSKTWGNGKVWALDCFIFWAHISTLWAVWKFICSLCSVGVLLSPDAFAVNVRKVISTCWGSSASMARSDQSTSLAQGLIGSCQYQMLQRRINSCMLWGLYIIIFKRR